MSIFMTPTPQGNSNRVLTTSNSPLVYFALKKQLNLFIVLRK